MDDERTPETPSEESVTAESATPAPSRPSPPPLEAFLGYRQRVNSDDGYIGSAMKEWHATLPEAERERLESDVDFFNSSWDRFEAARPPRPASPPQPPEPPAPREYAVPEWRRQQLAREARVRTPRLDATFSIGPGTMPEPGTAERVATRQHNREVNALRERVRGGENGAEVALAQALGLGNLGKPDWGPEHG